MIYKKDLPNINFFTTTKCIYLNLEGNILTFGIDEKKVSGVVESKDKTCSALNHFLDYFFITGQDKKAYDFLLMILNKRYQMREARLKIVERIEKDDMSVREVQINIFKEIMRFEPEHIKMVIEYVVGISVNNIEYDETKPDSLRYSEVDILNALSTMVKIIYIIYAMLNTDNIGLYLIHIQDYLFKIIVEAYIDYTRSRIADLESRIRTDEEDKELSSLSEEFYYMDSNCIISNIQEFLGNIFTKTWEGAHIQKHRERFHLVGQDDDSLSDKSITSVIVSLYKFTPVLEDEKLIPKYSKEDVKINKISYIRGMKDGKHNFFDFKFVHKNTTKFISAAIEFTLKNISKSKMENFTTTSIYNIDDESSFRSELYYSDKNSTMLETKKPLIENLLDLVTRDKEVRDLGHEFILYKNKHILNETIFGSFLKIILGENLVLSSLFGNFRVYILAAIYKFLRDKTHYTEIYKAMRSNAVDYRIYTTEDLQQLLINDEKYLNYGDIYLNAIRDVCVRYRDNEDNIVSITYDIIRIYMDYIKDYDNIRKEFLKFYGGYKEEVNDNCERITSSLATKTRLPDEDIEKIIDDILKI